MSKLLTASVEKIRANPISIRSVNRESESFLGLVESIKNTGFTESISVRERTDEETGDQYFEIINGLHRYTAACEAGLEEIPVSVVDMSDAEVLESQLMMNFHRVAMKPAEYSQHLRRILDMNPTMTEAELSQRLGVSPKFVKDRLNLNRITDPHIRELIDNGDIRLMSAYALSKLPEEEQAAMLDAALTESPAKFAQMVVDRTKQIREERRKGGVVRQPAEFTPTAHLRRVADLKEAIESAEILRNLEAQLPEGAPQIEAIKLGVKYALHLDPEAVAEQKAKWDAKEAEKAEKKRQREAKKAAKEMAELEKKRAEAEANAKKLAEDLDMDVDALKAEAMAEAEAGPETNA